MERMAVMVRMVATVLVVLTGWAFLGSQDRRATRAIAATKATKGIPGLLDQRVTKGRREIAVSPDQKAKRASQERTE